MTPIGARTPCRFTEEMRHTLYDGRDWCAPVLQTHATHPSLIYFRSVGTGAGWPAALGALMDLALIFKMVVDDPQSRAAAVLLRHGGLRLVGEIVALIGLQPEEDPTTANPAQAVCARLRGRRLPAAAVDRCRRVRRSAAAARPVHLCDHRASRDAPGAAPTLIRRRQGLVGRPLPPHFLDGAG